MNSTSSSTGGPKRNQDHPSPSSGLWR